MKIRISILAIVFTWPFILVSVGAIRAQNESPAAKEKKLLDDQKAAVLGKVMSGIKQRPRVLLLGTFHFQDAGLDDYKPKFVFDPLSEAGQKQVAEVLDRLERFAPTKIVVEYPAAQQGKLDELFGRFQEGKGKPSRNETTQLGFALAKRLKHGRVYAFDAQPNKDIPVIDVKAAAARLGQEKLAGGSAMRSYFEAIEILDKMKTELTLRQNLLIQNDPTIVRLGHGAYLIGSFKVSDGKEYPGADAFPTRWFNRNLRMFANLERIASAADDRLLVIVGAGHLGILRHCLESCPEMELVEVERYLSAK
jgi:hypothetical protein